MQAFRLGRVLAAGLAALALQAVAGRTAEAPIIAAASDLQFALTEVARSFTAETGREVKLAFGSSGNFFRQIRQGAPFAMFLSADERFVFDLADAGRTEDRGELYAVGRIVIIAPPGSSVVADGQLLGLRNALAAGKVARFAIANPEHAPYGQRAEEALRYADLWELLAGELVFGENVSQAAQFATSADAEGGIIAYSLALSPKVAGRGAYALIPEAWHRPLNQRMVLMKDPGDTARRFYAYMQGLAARTIMRRYGFGLPGEKTM